MSSILLQFALDDVVDVSSPDLTSIPHSRASKDPRANRLDGTLPLCREICRSYVLNQHTTLGCLGVSRRRCSGHAQDAFRCAAACFFSSSGLAADTSESSILTRSGALLVLGRQSDALQWLRTFCCVV